MISNGIRWNMQWRCNDLSTPVSPNPKKSNIQKMLFIFSRLLSTQWSSEVWWLAIPTRTWTVRLSTSSRTRPSRPSRSTFLTRESFGWQNRSITKPKKSILLPSSLGWDFLLILIKGKNIPRHNGVGICIGIANANMFQGLLPQSKISVLRYLKN